MVQVTWFINPFECLSPCSRDQLPFIVFLTSTGNRTRAACNGGICLNHYTMLSSLYNILTMFNIFLRIRFINFQNCHLYFKYVCVSMYLYIYMCVCVCVCVCVCGCLLFVPDICPVLEISCVTLNVHSAI